MNLPVIASSTPRGRLLIHFRFKNKPHRDHTFNCPPEITIRQAMEIAVCEFPDNCDYNAEAVYVYDCFGRICNVDKCVNEDLALVYITDDSEYFKVSLVGGIVFSIIVPGLFVYLMYWFFFSDSE